MQRSGAPNHRRPKSSTHPSRALTHLYRHARCLDYTRLPTGNPSDADAADATLRGGRMRTIRLCLTLVLLFSATVANVSAQSFQGGLRGTVKDAGGVVPGVAVMLINEETDVTRDTVTNAAGEYSFPAVDPGSYRMLAVITGYSSFERKGILINTQQFVALDITLQLGAIEETITVTGEAPLIDTTTASTGSIFDA